MTGGDKETFTVEGFYARCGFVVPGREIDFYIHHDPKRQKGLDGKDYGYVKFDVLKDDKGRTLVPDVNNRNELVPKYGTFYLCLFDIISLIFSLYVYLFHRLRCTSCFH